MIHSHQLSNYSCPFCKLIKGESNQHNSPEDVVFEDKKSIAFISPKWWPNNKGSVIIVPKEHVENIYGIGDDLLSHIQIIGKKIAIAVKKAYQCDGVSFRQHNESAGNQGVWHYHLHVLPRYEDDDLYLNHQNSKFIDRSEKKPYVEKLRLELEK